jgi:PAS domain S-box-containing protein
MKRKQHAPMEPGKEDPSATVPVFRRAGWLRGYATAMILTGATLAGCLALTDGPDDRLAAVIFTIPILLSAWVGGLGPGLLATAIAALATGCSNLASMDGADFMQAADFIQWLALLAAGVLASLVGESVRQARRTAASSSASESKAVEWRIRLGFALALVLLSAMGTASYFSVSRLLEHGDAVRRTEQLIDELHGLVMATIDVETGQRGYIITGEESFLAPLQQAERTVPERVEQIQVLLAGEDPALRQDFAAIAALVRERQARSKQAVEIRRTQGFAAARLEVSEMRGKVLQDAIRTRAADMEDAIDRRVLEKEAAAQRSVRIALVVIEAGGVAAVIVVIVALFVVARDFARSRRAEEALREARTALEQRVEERTAELASINTALIESEGRLRLFVEHAPAALAMFDREMRYLTASRRWRDDYGLGGRELTGHSHYAIFPEIGEAWKSIHRRALQGEVVRSESDPFVRANGTTLWLRWEVRPWRDARGAIGGIVIFSEDITASHATAAAHARLAAIVESSEDAIIGTTTEGAIESWNRSAERMFGYAASELAGRPVARLLVPDRPEGPPGLLARIAAGERVNHLETACLRKDGTRIAVAVTLSPVRDAAGRIAGASVIARDISAAQRTAAALRESEERFRALVSLSPDAVFVNQDGRIVYMNRRGLQLWRAEREEQILGRSPLELFHPSVHDQVRQRIARLLAEGGTAPLQELLGVAVDGTPMPVETTAAVLLHGGQRAIQVVVRDISERRRAEAALRESEGRIQAIVDNLTEGLVVADLDGTLLHWNAAARRMHGLGHLPADAVTLADFAASFVLKTLDGEPIPVESWPIARIIRGERLRDQEARFRLAGEADERIFRYNGSRVTTPGGQSLAYVAIADVTERHRAEAARERERRRAMLLADISHRLVAAESPREALEQVFSDLAGEVGVDLFVNFLMADDAGRLVLGCSRGLGPETIADYQELPPGTSKSLSSLVARRQEPLVLAGLARSELPEAAGLIAQGVRAYAGYPLIAGGRLIGTIAFGARNRDAFVEDDLRLMQTVAQQVSVAWERAHLLGDLRRSEQRYRTLYDTMVQGVALHDASGAVVALNPAGWRILGLEPDEPAGRAASAVGIHAIREDGSPFPLEDHPALQALREGREVRNAVIGYLNRRDGLRHWIVIDAVPQFAEGDPHPTGVFTIFRDITDRKAAEEALRESEALFSTAFRASPLPIAINRRSDLVNLEVNDAFLRAFQCRREDIVGHTLVEAGLVDAASIEVIRARLDQTGTFQNLELAMRAHGGAERRVDLAVQVIRLAGESCSLSILIDITERKRAEEALRFHETVLRETGRIAKVGGWSFEVPDGAGYWTEEVARIHDLDPDDPVSREQGLRYYRGESRQRIEVAVRAAMEQGEPYDLELEITTARGRRKWVRTIGHPVLEAGRVVRVRGSFQDITERKQAERRLATQAAIGRVLAEAATLGEATPRILQALCESEDWQFGAIWEIDATDGRLHCIELWSQPGFTPAEELVEATRKLSFGPGEGLPGRVWQSREVALIADVAENGNYLRAGVAGRAGLHSALAFPILSAGEVTGVIDFLAAEIHAVDEHLTGLFELIGRQVGLYVQRRRAEMQVHALNAELEDRVLRRTAELETANKELEAFSYSVSHDLRAPLRAIDGFAQALAEDYGPQLPEGGARYVQLIQRGAQRMGRLIDDLLRLSRLSRQPLNRRPVSMEKLAAEVWAELAPERGARAIEFVAGPMPDAEGDATLLRQIWANLLSNAVKYSGRCAAARIEIGAAPAGGEPVYFVRDNGAGFDMRYAHKLFGVFQRLHRAEEYPGTGVGLAIVHRMVQRHGGRVWAEGAVGRGATFHFTLGSPCQTHG